MVVSHKTIAIDEWMQNDVPQESRVVLNVTFDPACYCKKLRNHRIVMELVAAGIRGQHNHLLYYCPSVPIQNVIFFQGDTQVSREASSLSL